ncbi:MAG TPA: DUF2075 domain-containing protein [Companilactobacillus farciminis]|uniref:DUF2075 domain-containing protein n=1 Tax=Companilactobacillus farciminis TaxID=1612 RepID=A0A921L9K7_9LACO|nr:DUF2075 domain-containing protein [Companilactobacillus farciminis]
MEKNISKPLVEKVKYNSVALKKFENKLVSSRDSKEDEILFRYPTIYIVNDKYKHTKGVNNEYSVYVGETNDIKRRTNEHLLIDSKNEEFWREIKNSPNSEMFLIGHEHFNKSLTLDLENRLMHYMSGIEAVKSISNKRTNQQNKYYTSDELDIIFEKLWTELRDKKRDLFPSINVIKDSAIFKSSPFQKLTLEQFEAKDQIIAKIEENLNREKNGQLIWVTGEAGTGKTVLLSNLFYELYKSAAENSDNVILRNRTVSLLVNHDQQVKVYQQIASKLGMTDDNNPEMVTKPTHFILNHTPEEKIDVVLVDEAHLLWTQGKQSYRGKDQLDDLLNRARVVVAVFDPSQILTTEEYRSLDWIQKSKLNAISHNNYIKLENQMRIHGNKETVNWIRTLVDESKIKDIPKDDSFDLKIFKTPHDLLNAIKTKARDERNGISRLLATFDWKYVSGKKDENGNLWQVTIGDFSMPWNLQLPRPKKIKKLPWAEQPQTIDEIGSTFTIQGFDLNYAGVIIGPSVKYRNGKIIFDKTASKNKKATQKRNSKIDNSQEFLKNELNVLLTRGVNGLYIYAVDEELQNQLLKAQGE